MNNSSRKNIVCFGTCDMLWNGGFIAGMKEFGANVTTFGFSNISAGSHIYNLKRTKNANILKNADLIVLGISEEQGVDEVYKNNIRNFQWLYRELYELQKKVVVVIWHYYQMYSNRYANFHQSQCAFYGFNLIDVHQYCKDNGILDFFLKIPDFHHPLFEISKRSAIEICRNIDKYYYPKKNNLGVKNRPNFTVVELGDLDNLKLIKARNHIGTEFVLSLKSDSKFFFPQKYHGKILLGVHTWNRVCQVDHSCYVLENKKYCFGKMSWGWETFSEIYLEDFVIDDITKLHVNYRKEITKQRAWPLQVGSHGIGLIGFLLVDKVVIDECENYFDDDVHNFSNVMFFLKEYSNLIKQYEAKIKFNDIKDLEVKNKDLEVKNKDLEVKNKDLEVKNNLIFYKSNFISKYGTAKSRIQNQLSYKLGQAMIVNSKSILGYIRMPFVLSYIKDKHKQEQKIYQEKIKKDPSLKLPPLESYPDYKEALKLKNHLSYKLGQALIQANKTWYKGGYVKMLLVIKKIKSKRE
ncbi:hypothetical protein L8W57_07655 [Campylobacter sp. IFREMER_LSEM_CL1890]|uniref:hypothetical protein n=1 Tax=Campylobacter sp. IFREMER_LSEM_CL1890 TaxID=2911615 RepID=UPI0021E672F0|nr:hypothetical protein [Campylobacter sp. IFREMER_LSEM_CL1890]MCV3409995.1 hypothetical protein [Campylobacter sp. IFREMER_LSEM_CL1890]